MASPQTEILKNSPDELDRILGSMALGEDKIRLSESELQRLQNAELSLELLEEYNGNKRLVVASLMQRPVNALSRTLAYQACTDAQTLFGYITAFDYSFELLIKKNRLEGVIKKAETAGDRKSMSMPEKEHTRVFINDKEYIS